jgi:hypothetical protein
MTSSIPAAHRNNQVLAVGALDLQIQRGRQQTRINSRNALRGHEEQIALQVRSPFGQVYALPVQLDTTTEGAELLAHQPVGAPLAISGSLKWSRRADMRYAVAPGERGRQVNELVFRALAVRAATAEDEPGCDVWVSGIVQSPPKVVRHPHKPSVLLAQTALKVSVEQRRNNSRATLVETERVPLVVPLDHPDAPKLLRPGNQVVVEGMLERVALTLRGPDVDRAVAAAEAEWQARRPALESHPDALRAAERQHARHLQGLGEAVRNRVVAGYVELITGTPMSLREAQELRQEQVRAQQARIEQKTGSA